MRSDSGTSARQDYPTNQGTESLYQSTDWETNGGAAFVFLDIAPDRARRRECVEPVSERCRSEIDNYHQKNQSPREPPNFIIDSELNRSSCRESIQIAHLKSLTL